jgi:ParB-like chromosome segregation protein Spo0J
MSNVESTTTATRPTPSATPELPPNPQDLPNHPELVESWPPADPHEVAAIGNSIKAQGIQFPITLWRDESGKWWKIDGRTRTSAAKSVDYRFRPTDFKVFVGDFTAAVAYVEVCNGHRRHLSKEQKEERALKLIAKYPGMGSRKLALIVGVSHSTIARLRTQDEEDTTYKALERAWINASGDAQEQFARAFRIDLAEMLRL